MKLLTLIACLGALGAVPGSSTEAQARQPSKESAPLGPRRTDWLAGKKIKWTFVDGPVAGWTFEHSFNADGSVTWRITDGPHKGATEGAKSYAAVKVTENIWVVSYLAPSGNTLTVVLNLNNHRMVGFGSNEKSWASQTGTFELLN
jgi:phenolic acid decarboxylase